MKLKMVETHELVKNCLFDTDNLDFKEFISNFSSAYGKNLDHVKNWEEFMEIALNGYLDWEFNDYIFNHSGFEIEENWGDQENYNYIL